MGKCEGIHQLRLLLWKNFTLKRRKPFLLFMEIILPLFITVILVLVRTKQFKFQHDRCFLHEKQLDSVSGMMFARDFFCFYNTTCSDNTTIYWAEPNKAPDTMKLVENFTDVFASLRNVPINPVSIALWMFQNPNEVEKLTYGVAYLSKEMVIIEDLRNFLSAMSKNFINETAFERIATKFCGTSKNDMKSLLKVFFFSSNGLNSTRTKRSASISCQTEAKNALSGNVFSKNLYKIINPLIWGKIFYAPKSPLTDEIIKRANATFESLDYLRLAAIDWRLRFRVALEYTLVNSSFGVQFKSSLESCAGTIPACANLNRSYTPENISSMLNAVSQLMELIEKALNCTQLNKFVGLVDPSAFDQFNSDVVGDAFAGVVFNPTIIRAHNLTKPPTFLSYSIRMSTARIDGTSQFKVLDRQWTPFPRINFLTDIKYYISGFSNLQQMLDYGFIELLAFPNKTINRYMQPSIEQGNSFQIMPYPCYVIDRFIQFLAAIFPLMLVISFSSSFTFLIKSIVYEKEKRLKEFMKVMGLSNLVHWVAWFISTISIMFVSTVLMTILIHVFSIYKYTSPAVTFLVLFSYSVSIICQCFMISVFFNNANIAGVVGGVLYFLFYLPFTIVTQKDDAVTTSTYYGISLSAQVAFCNAFNFISNWEESTIGSNLNNLMTSTVLNLDFGVGHCIAMLWLDALIYLIITWYVEAVFPGQYGVPKPFYFLFTPSYWCGNSEKCQRGNIAPSDYDPILMNPSLENSKPEDEHNNNNNGNLTDNNFEPDPQLKVGISIKNLCKTYGKSSTPAVDNLNLNFYQSQITAFLGHNGAGKTTTISILTGIFPASSGTALIEGLDIKSDIDPIRKIIGLCPQHNILFDILTVEDHIYFYGMLKGLSSKEIKAELPKITSEVGLTKKRYVFSKKLSGGMKRKLSIAMAFIGNAKVVFLDEPTAGVDPFARRGIWDLLVKYRQSDRTIILTTHHMDEADYLSDRIAIISKGKLRCCGSSVFLKRTFGEGYYLSLEKDNNLSGTKENTRTKNLLKYIKQYISNAHVSEETRAAWMIALPTSDRTGQEFASLFENLDRDMRQLGVASYGVSDTTLEEVFLRVAEEQEEDGEIPIATPNRLVLSAIDIQDEVEIKTDEPTLTETPTDHLEVDLLTGSKKVSQQIEGLFIKRFHYTKRNIKGFFSEIILPVLLMLAMIAITKSLDLFEEQPEMVIRPWLMMPKDRYTNLYTFYRREKFPLINTNSTSLANKSLRDMDRISGKLEENYRTDLGESGIRCMNGNIYQLPNRKCYSVANSFWTPAPQNVSLESPACDCEQTGMQKCSNPLSGGPKPSQRLMESSDILRNLTGYNISDHLLNNFREYAQKQYGGLQMVLPSEYGMLTRALALTSIWDNLKTITRFNATTDFPFYTGAFFNISGRRTSFARVWVNSKGYPALPSYLNIFDTMLLRIYAGQSQNTTPLSDYGLSVANYPFKYSNEDLLKQLNRQMSLELALSTFIILSLSLIPASFVLFLVEERVTGSKRQQFVSGVSPYIYWISTFLWDVLKYAFSVFFIVIIFIAFRYESYIGNKNFGAFIAILLLYGLSIIPHMYPFTMYFKIPSTGFVVLYSYNVITGSITTIATFFLDLLQNDDPSLVPINDGLKKAFLVFPQYCLGRGMMDMSYQYLQRNVTGKDYDIFSWDIIGNKICALMILSVCWFSVLFLMESGLYERMCGALRNSKVRQSALKTNGSQEQEDPDIKAEQDLVRDTPAENYALKVDGLVKVYDSGLDCGKDDSSKYTKCCCIPCCCKKTKTGDDEGRRKLAVNNITFGVHDGECFGLLGVNGAGKTTTFKMLTGEETLTRGDAHINAYSVLSDINAAHLNMGFCPQFDALHNLLSCREELWLYCRLRGIPPKQIVNIVNKSMLDLNLTIHADKTTQSLSGGNKRKLSTAVALIGNPKVIFLDEPTAGMDAGARRFLWGRIQSLTSATSVKKHAVVLTSHNMEECEVLCHRLSIMVDGELKCIGSLPHLKAKFGNDYQIKIRMSPTQNRDKIFAEIKKQFGDAFILQDENFVTLVYRFDPNDFKLSFVFELFELMKRHDLLLDFSISQTTLDEIFVNFAKEKQVDRLLSTGLRKSISREVTMDNKLIAKNPPNYNNAWGVSTQEEGMANLAYDDVVIKPNNYPSEKDASSDIDIIKYNL